MNHIGLDIHKRFTYAVAKDQEGNLLGKEKFDNSKENFRMFLQIFPPEETKIVMESTGVWEYIYSILHELKYEVKLANPVKTKAIAYARVKTDAVDAGTLADLSRANLVAESFIPDEEIRKLREITRLRRVLSKQKTQIENRIHAILTRRGIVLPTKELGKKALQFLHSPEKDVLISHYMEMLELVRQRLASVDKGIIESAEKNEDAKVLITIPGISHRRAMEIIAEIGTIERFSSSDKLCSYAGLVPCIRQSGTTLRFGRLMRQASRTLKHCLVQTAWVAVRTKKSNSLQQFYQRLTLKKSKQKAICATARKLCSIIYAMLKKQEEFKDV